MIGSGSMDTGSGAAGTSDLGGAGAGAGAAGGAFGFFTLGAFGCFTALGAFSLTGFSAITIFAFLDFNATPSPIIFLFASLLFAASAAKAARFLTTSKGFNLAISLIFVRGFFLRDDVVVPLFFGLIAA